MISQNSMHVNVCLYQSVVVQSCLFSIVILHCHQTMLGLHPTMLQIVVISGITYLQYTLQAISRFGNNCNLDAVYKLPVPNDVYDG